jgi:hypothetical protein
MKCTATKKDGTPCTLPAKGPDGLCWAHDPKNAQARRAGASRGGRGNSETRAIKKLINTLTQQVLAGEVQPYISHAVVALLNVKIRVVDLELKLKEQLELIERLEALEEAQQDALQSEANGSYYG